MKQRTKKRLSILYSWILLLVFMGAQAGKTADLHFVDENFSHVRSHVEHVDELESYCSICHFTFEKSEYAQISDLKSEVTMCVLSRYVESQQVVYRPVQSVNSHSPPVRA